MYASFACAFYVGANVKLVDIVLYRAPPWWNALPLCMECCINMRMNVFVDVYASACVSVLCILARLCLCVVTISCV